MKNVGMRRDDEGDAYTRARRHDNLERERDGPRAAGEPRGWEGEERRAMEGRLAGAVEGGERGAAVGQSLSRQAPASG